MKSYSSAEWKQIRARLKYQFADIIDQCSPIANISASVYLLSNKRL